MKSIPILVGIVSAFFAFSAFAEAAPVAEGFTVTPPSTLLPRQLQSSVNITCAAGFGGARCLACADGFFPKIAHSGSFALECEACPARGSSYLALIGGMLLGGVGIAYMCVVAIKYALVRDSAFVPLAKVVVGFMQTIALARFFPIVWTPELAGLWAGVDGMASVSTYLGGAHCLGFDDTSGWRATAGTQLLVPFVIVLPVTLLVLAVARAACSGCCAAAKAPVQPSADTPTPKHAGQWTTSAASTPASDSGKAPAPAADALASTATAPGAGSDEALTASSAAAYVSTYTDNAIACTIVVAWCMYVTLAATAYSFMGCLRIGGERSLIPDPNFLCDGSEGWMSAVGVPAFILYGIGIPAVFAFILYRNKDALNEPQTLHRYGFLYGSLQDAVWYWPIGVHFRKLLVVIFVTAIAPCGVGIQSMSIVLDLGLVHIAHDRSKPFRLPLLNLLESFSMLFAAVALTSSTAIVGGAAVKGDIRVQTTWWIIGQSAIFILAVFALLVKAHMQLPQGVGAPGSLLGPEAPLTAAPKPDSLKSADSQPATSVVPAPVQQQA